MLDVTPEQFGFPDVIDVALEKQVTSSIVIITDVEVPVLVEMLTPGGEFRVCRDPICLAVTHEFSDGAQGMIENGQFLQLRATSGSSPRESSVTTVRVGGVTADWKIVVGDGPDDIAFKDSVAPRNRPVSTGIVKVTGMLGPVMISVVGDDAARFRICADPYCDFPLSPFQPGPATLQPGQFIELTATTPSAADMAVVNAITVGVRTLTWKVSSEDAPDAFAFTAVTGAPLNTRLASDVKAITGLNGTCALTPGTTTPEYRICADLACTTELQPFTTSPGVLRDNTFIQLRGLTANTSSTLVTFRIDVCGNSQSWTVTTGSGPGPLTFHDVHNATQATLLTSNIATVTGAPSAVALSFSGPGEFRVCADAMCTVEARTWGTAATTIVDGQAVQLRATSGGPDSTVTVSVSSGARTESWSLVTLPADLIQPVMYSASSTRNPYTGLAGTGTMWDGDYVADTSVWGSANVAGSWVQAAFSTVYAVTAVNIAPTMAGVFSAPSTDNVAVQCSNNGSSWVTLFTTSGTEASETRRYPVDAKCRFIRLFDPANSLAAGDLWFQGRTVANAPAAFDFTDLDMQTPLTEVRSNIVTVSGLAGVNPQFSVESGPVEFRICADSACATELQSWSTATAIINNGQAVQLRVTAGMPGTTVSSVVRLANAPDSWAVTTFDHVPDPFTFDTTVNDPLATQRFSSVALISGLVGATPISVTGDSSAAYRICADPLCASVVQDFSSTAGTISAGRYAQLRITTSAAYGSMTSATLDVGGRTGTWVSTTVTTDACASPTMLGAPCPDGTLYAGISPDNTAPLFTTRCNEGQSWFGNACVGQVVSYYVASSGLPPIPSSPDTATGQANTQSWLVYDLLTMTPGLQPYLPAQLCAAARGGAHTDWYLPASGELQVLYTNRTALGLGGASDTLPYWSSSTVTSMSGGITYYFLLTVSMRDGTYGGLGMLNLPVRCVRTPKIDGDPVPFTFADTTNVTTNTLVASAATRITGISGPQPVSIGGNPSAEYRVCNTSDCATPRIPWGAAPATIYGGEYLQLRMPSGSSASALSSVMVQAGTATAAWRVVVMATDPCAGMINPGTVCLDGTVYAGISPDGMAPMFAARCDIGMTWDGAACAGTRSQLAWNNGNSTGQVATGAIDLNTGRANTDLIVTIDADSGAGGVQVHRAAQSCADLGAHARSDWYLPARAELSVVIANKNAIGNFSPTSTNAYWSSTEEAAAAATSIRGTGAINSGNKNGGNHVRCVRR